MLRALLAELFPKWTMRQALSERSTSGGSLSELASLQRKIKMADKKSPGLKSRGASFAQCQDRSGSQEYCRGTHGGREKWGSSSRCPRRSSPQSERQARERCLKMDIRCGPTRQKIMPGFRDNAPTGLVPTCEIWTLQDQAAESSVAMRLAEPTPNIFLGRVWTILRTALAGFIDDNVLSRAAMDFYAQNVETKCLTGQLRICSAPLFPPLGCSPDTFGKISV
jgi:hypothetical protein